MLPFNDLMIAAAAIEQGSLRRCAPFRAAAKTNLRIRERGLAAKRPNLASRWSRLNLRTMTNSAGS